jgi:hypothetical protein
MDFSIRHGVDTFIEENCMNIYIWCRRKFHLNEDNYNEVNEETVPLISVDNEDDEESVSLISVNNE